MIKAGATYWEARGSVMKSPGFTKILKGGSEDSELPPLRFGATLSLAKAWHTAKQTTPPPRYSEPRLVQTLEKLGIGRPSTFANIMKILKEREFVSVKGKTLVPTAVGLKTDETLMKVLPTLIRADFTAQMEASLDKVAEGKLDWQKYLIAFYFDFFLPAIEGAAAKSLMSQAYPKSDIPCPDCGKPLSKLPSKFKDGPKDHYLKCLEGCSGVILFWNRGVNDWVKKGEKVDSPEKPPGKLTDFVCQCCGSKLEEYAYQKDGQEKLMLRCSSGCYKKPETKELSVYFQGKKGGFWNFQLQSEPLTEKVAGGLQSAVSKKKASAPAGSKAKSKKPIKV